MRSFTSIRRKKTYSQPIFQRKNIIILDYNPSEGIIASLAKSLILYSYYSIFPA